jgi:hypothetical protein
MAAGVLLSPGYLGQSGSRCALLAGWDRVVHKSRTTAAMAAGVLLFPVVYQGTWGPKNSLQVLVRSGPQKDQKDL